MQAVSYILAAIVGFFGLMFVVGFQGSAARLIVGVILLGAAVALVVMARLRPSQTTLVQRIDLPGDTAIQEMKCRSCGAPLTSKSIKMRLGAPVVECEHCGASYQLEEEAKW